MTGFGSVAPFSHARSLLELTLLVGISEQYLCKIRASRNLLTPKLVSTMERPLILASICAACFAFLLLGLYPGILKATASSLVNYFLDSDTNQARLSDIHSTGSITSKTPWDIHYHLGGNGPWIPLVHGSTADDIDPPDRCVVEQVHMVRTRRFMAVGIISDISLFSFTDVKTCGAVPNCIRRNQ